MNNKGVEYLVGAIVEQATEDLINGINGKSWVVNGQATITAECLYRRAEWFFRSGEYLLMQEIVPVDGEKIIQMAKENKMISDFLEDVYAEGKKLELLAEKIEEMEIRMCTVSSPELTERVQSNPASMDSLADNYIKLDELKKKYSDLCKEHELDIKELERCKNQLTHKRYGLLLEARYMHLYSWRKVGEVIKDAGMQKPISANSAMKVKLVVVKELHAMGLCEHIRKKYRNRLKSTCVSRLDRI